MNSRRKCAALLTIVVVLVAAGCSDREQPVHQQKRQFTIVMRSKLGQFERRTNELSSQLETDSLGRLQVDSLEASYGLFRTRIDSIAAENVTQWNKVKPTLEAEYYDLERRYYEIASGAATRAAERAAADTLAVSVMADSTGTIAEPREDSSPKKAH